ncbi:MAG: hypothetical protein EA426_19635 [Spirochaetaceae bacterium]|nr:MAG: hypothetical protein EA426_19635 [Spirochaetaceae bacterium]
MDQDRTLPQERTLLEGLLHYLGIILRYKWFILVVTILAAAGVVAFSIRSLQLPPEESPLPNRYRAYARLLLRDEAQDGMVAMLEALGAPAPRGGTAGSGRLVLEVFNSRSFIDRIIEMNDMVAYYDMADATRTQQRDFVRSNTGGGLDAQAGILTLSYEDIRPEFAQQFANSIVDELDRYFRDRGGLTRGVVLESLRETLAAVESRVASIEAEIRAFQQRYGVLTVEELATSQTAMIRGLEADLVTLERAIRTQTERTRIENDPELIRLRSERDIVSDLIREIEAGYAGGERTMPPRSQLPQLSLELGRLRADLELQQRLRTSLQEQYEIARLSAEANPGFTILEYAELPDEKTGPARGQISMMVTAGAFAGSIFLSFLHYGYKSIRKDPKLMKMLSPEKGT